MRALLLLGLLLSGCRKNHEELLARLADVERQLARQQAVAERVIQDRRALAHEEEELARALAEFPEDKALTEDAPPAPAVVTTFPPLPPESAFEGSRGEQLRRFIKDTELRIVQLEKIVGEVEKLTARRQHVQRQLALIRARQQAGPK